MPASPLEAIATIRIADPAPASLADGGKHFAIVVACAVALLVFHERVAQAVGLRGAETKVAEQAQAAAWCLFAALLVSGVLLQPIGEDPSAVLTVGAGMQLFSFCLLWAVPAPAPPAEFAALMAVALGLRLTSTCRFQGYLPTDATGDGLYQGLEGLALLLALQGLRQGLTKRQGLHCFGAILLTLPAVLVCHGDLDRRPVWDQVYAGSLYVEFLSWSFVAYAKLGRSFYVPAVGQAACRAFFWHGGRDELRPLRPQWLSPWFPEVIAALFALLVLGLALRGLRAGRNPVPALSTIPTTHASDAGMTGVERTADTEVRVSLIDPQECSKASKASV